MIPDRTRQMYLHYKECQVSSQRVHTDYGYRETFMGVSWPEGVADKSPHLSPRLRMYGAITPGHHMPLKRTEK